VKTPCFIPSHNGIQKPISFLCVACEKLQRGSCVEKSYDGTHLAFGGTLDRRCHFKHVSLKQPVLPLLNEHGSQVKDQGRRQCCHNKNKNFPYRPTRDVSLHSGHASYNRPFSPSSLSLRPECPSGYLRFRLQGCDLFRSKDTHYRFGGQCCLVLRGIKLYHEERQKRFLRNVGIYVYNNRRYHIPGDPNCDTALAV
jgi:hypothetical protein